MEKLNLPFFYQLGAQLGPLTKSILTENNRLEIGFAANLAEGYVSALMTAKSFASLNVCRPAGYQLLSAIADVKKWLNETPPDNRKDIDISIDMKFWTLVNKAKEFETILLAELQTLGTYLVTIKGIYSIAGLVNNAEYMLPDSIRLKVRQNVVDELRQSGMCLAFDVPTASAFHILRATEIILHEYYICVCKPLKKKTTQKLG
jgi:hypothetical protein